MENILQTQARNLLLDVLYNDSNKPDLLFHAIELIFQKYDEQGLYITLLDIDIENNLAVKIETTTVKPESYNYKELRQYLLDLYTGLAIVQKCIVGICISYDKPTIIKTRELPNNRVYPYNLKELPS